ncbi:zinc finger CCCH domain-containing protein 1 [Physcomitrium patens]|uniref:Uncharacterized protein n=1 Tax=Physcomitrium patens TaxID=3218 RepID=A9SSR1_PHYPA|nr:zinc finger CCCH domain-containing protein 15-like [Physcomitrium patens]PNR49728.1 hypothetical protein PHYPA_011624 [Physcomitrium patens]|eukprot:XP_024382662.1 zinc finger CCCH domain-containing protein 15-like [Physcomitrella patens]
MEAPSEAGAAAAPAAGAFFKKKIQNKNIRKRPTIDDGDEEEENAGSAVNKGKIAKKGVGRLEFNSGAPVGTSKVQNSEESDKAGEVERATFVYESTRQVQTQDDSRATAVSEIETEFDRDNRAIRERVLKQASEALKSGEPSNSKVYKGIHGYTDHKAGFRQEHTISREKAGGAHGPLRASAHIRMTVRFDYQPDICKDYKETGYCGYGDSCKFMHDRGDYKSGWQMEREWDQEEKLRKQRLARGEADTEEGEGAGDDSDDEDALPFACFICREPFTDPVVTTCKHYFCEHCALKHHSRNKLCYVCNKPTNGVFNTAHEIVRKQKEAKQAAEGGD